MLCQYVNNNNEHNCVELVIIENTALLDGVYSTQKCWCNSQPTCKGYRILTRAWKTHFHFDSETNWQTSQGLLASRSVGDATLSLACQTLSNIHSKTKTGRWSVKWIMFQIQFCVLGKYIRFSNIESFNAILSCPERVSIFLRRILCP